MRLKRLSLRDFRNYSALDFSPGACLNLLQGENAQGKTNLLEAVYYLATGRSHRLAKDPELVRWRQQAFSLWAEVERDVGETSIKVSFSLAERRKEIEVNGQPLERLSQLFGAFNAVLFCPDDLLLVKGSPFYRRHWLDLCLARVSLSYRNALAEYQRALLQRNSLLREIYSSAPLLERGGELEVWEAQLVRAGSLILWQRRAAVEELAELSASLHGRISGERERLTCRYLSSLGEVVAQARSAEEVRDFFAQSLRAARRDELRRGATSIGPHRDDLLLLLDGEPLRTYGSQGQQRTAALVLRLAELEFMRRVLGEYPVLLLDDALSELDEERQRRVLKEVEREVQILATTAQELPLSLKEEREITRFTVCAGEVKPSA